MNNFIKTGLAQLALLAGTMGLAAIPAQAGVTVPKCAPGEIPGSPTTPATCLAELEGFKIQVYSAKLCQQHPMPTGSNKVDLTTCFNLFESSTKKDIDIALSSSVALPDSGRSSTIPNGTYTHFVLVMQPWIQQKGTYTASNGLTYRTVKLEDKWPDNYLVIETGDGDDSYLKNVVTSSGNPEWVGDTFTSQCGWGDENYSSTDGGPEVFTGCGTDLSDYCDAGSTITLCNLDYNGGKLTGIMASTDLQPLAKAERFIYVSEIETPIPLNTQTPGGTLEVSVIQGAEITGNGEEVIWIYGQPFIFNVKRI